MNVAKIGSHLWNRRTPTSVEGHFLARDFVQAMSTFELIGKNRATSREAIVAFAASVLNGEERADYLSEVRVPSRQETKAAALAEPMCGPLIQKSPEVKHLSLAYHAEKYQRHTFVETGTYIGLTPAFLSGFFREIVTIEADPELHFAACRLFEVLELGNITVHCGDSANILGSLDLSKGSDALIFLDAHYSRGVTSRKFGICPVTREISLATSRWPNAILVVDDLRTMTGRRGYPHLLDVIGAIQGPRETQILQDQLVILPSDQRNEQSVCEGGEKS